MELYGELRLQVDRMRPIRCGGIPPRRSLGAVIISAALFFQCGQRGESKIFAYTEQSQGSSGKTTNNPAAKSPKQNLFNKASTSVMSASFSRMVLAMMPWCIFGTRRMNNTSCRANQ